MAVVYLESLAFPRCFRFMVAADGAASILEFEHCPIFPRTQPVVSLQGASMGIILVLPVFCLSQLLSALSAIRKESVLSFGILVEVGARLIESTRKAKLQFP